MECKLMFVLRKTIFRYNFVIIDLLIKFQMFKIVNCVALHFGNTDMYSRNYVESF